MRVLQIINSLGTGGAEKLLLESLPLFYKEGLEVDLLLLDGNDYPFLVELEKKFKGKIFKIAKKKFVYNPLYIFKIKSYMKRYDLIHVHLFPALYLVSLTKKIFNLKVKTVYTEHNTHNKRRNIQIFNYLDKIFYLTYNKIITIAEEVDSNLKKYLKSKDNSKFILINNGVNCEIYNNALPYAKSDFFNDDALILIQVSSFRKQKDQITLVKAISKLPQKYKLLLVGTGPLENECEELTTTLRLVDRVKFLGIRMDVPRLLKTSDITVLSSHYEGLSLSSIEAMASGKPFIASNVSGLREIVKDAGVLFKESDEDDLVKKIIKLSLDKEHYNLISEKCIKKSNEFDLRKMVKNYVKMYYNVCKE